MLLELFCSYFKMPVDRIQLDTFQNCISNLPPNSIAIHATQAHPYTDGVYIDEFRRMCTCACACVSYFENNPKIRRSKAVAVLCAATSFFMSFSMPSHTSPHQLATIFSTNQSLKSSQVKKKRESKWIIEHEIWRQQVKQTVALP